MKFIYCENCGKKSGYKRLFGWGTFFAVIVTCGLWLIALPFYPLRCMICGNISYRREPDLDKLGEKMRKARKL